MSAHYEIQEHLIIENRPLGGGFSVKEQAVSIMDYQLSLLGALLLQENARLDALTLTAEGTNLTLSPQCGLEDLGKMMRTLRTAADLELTVRYGFTVYGMNGVGQAAGPYVLMTLMEELNPQELEGMFYSVWLQSDCDIGAGLLYAYGSRNGVCHHGRVEPRAVSAYPAGEWYANTDVVVELEGLAPEQVRKITPICQKLSRLHASAEPEQLTLPMDGVPLPQQSPVKVSESTVSYFMSNAMLRSPEDICQRLWLFDELSALTDGECGFIGEYVDLSAPDVRLLYLDHSDHCTDRVQVAAV